MYCLINDPINKTISYYQCFSPVLWKLYKKMQGFVMSFNIWINLCAIFSKFSIKSDTQNN